MKQMVGHERQNPSALCTSALPLQLTPAQSKHTFPTLVQRCTVQDEAINRLATHLCRPINNYTTLINQPQRTMPATKQVPGGFTFGASPPRKAVGAGPAVAISPTTFGSKVMMFNMESGSNPTRRSNGKPVVARKVKGDPALQAARSTLPSHGSFPCGIAVSFPPWSPLSLCPSSVCL
jgi:hypothetical protein